MNRFFLFIKALFHSLLLQLLAAHQSHALFEEAQREQFVIHKIFIKEEKTWKGCGITLEKVLFIFVRENLCFLPYTKPPNLQHTELKKSLWGAYLKI